MKRTSWFIVTVTSTAALMAAATGAAVLAKFTSTAPASALMHAGMTANGITASPWHLRRAGINGPEERNPGLADSFPQDGTLTLSEASTAGLHGANAVDLSAERHPSASVQLLATYAPEIRSAGYSIARERSDADLRSSPDGVSSSGSRGENNRAMQARDGGADVHRIDDHRSSGVVAKGSTVLVRERATGGATGVPEPGPLVLLAAAAAVMCGRLLLPTK